MNESAELQLQSPPLTVFVKLHSRRTFWKAGIGSLAKPAIVLIDVLFSQVFVVAGSFDWFLLVCADSLSVQCVSIKATVSRIILTSLLKALVTKIKRKKILK